LASIFLFSLSFVKLATAATEATADAAEGSLPPVSPVFDPVAFDRVVVGGGPDEASTGPPDEPSSLFNAFCNPLSLDGEPSACGLATAALGTVAVGNPATRPSEAGLFTRLGADALGSFEVGVEAISCDSLLDTKEFAFGDDQGLCCSENSLALPIMLVKWPFFSTLDFVDVPVSRGFFDDSLSFHWEVFFVDSDFSALDFVEVEVGHWLAAPADLEGCVDDEALDFTEVELGDKVVIACEPATTAAADPAAETFAEECAFALSGTIGFFDSATLVFVEGCLLGLD
jgi:hypothetical protein